MIHQVWIYPHLPANMSNHIAGSMCIDNQDGEAVVYQWLKKMNNCTSQRSVRVNKATVPVADALLLIKKQLTRGAKNDITILKSGKELGERIGGVPKGL